MVKFFLASLALVSSVSLFAEKFEGGTLKLSNGRQKVEVSLVFSGKNLSRFSNHFSVHSSEGELKLYHVTYPTDFKLKENGTLLVESTRRNYVYKIDTKKMSVISEGYKSF